MSTKLTQFVVEEPEEELHPALIRHDVCGKVVPRTALCMYCGQPIMWGKDQ